jgi:hypothetical protein
VDCFDGTGYGMGAFVGALEEVHILGFVVVVPCGDGAEGGDAGGFGVDGREGECAVVVG